MSIQKIAHILDPVFDSLPEKMKKLGLWLTDGSVISKLVTLLVIIGTIFMLRLIFKTAKEIAYEDKYDKPKPPDIV